MSADATESDVVVRVVRRKKEKKTRSWIGDARKPVALIIEGWLAHKDDPSHVFVVKAVENAAVIATATTGRVCSFAPPEYGERTGFRLQLPVTLLDGQIHRIGLVIDDEPVREFDIDGSETGVGFVDQLGPQSVHGWAFSYANPSAPAEVEVFCRGVLCGRGLASAFRQDLAGMLGMSGFQAFHIKLDRHIFIDDLPELTARLADGGPFLTFRTDLGSNAELEPRPAAPRLKGHVDSVSASGVVGWAYDTDDPQRRVRINVAVDGVLFGGVIADAQRADLVRALGTDGKQGFHIDFPPRLGLRGKVSVQTSFAETGTVFSTQDANFEELAGHTELTGKALEEGFGKYLYKRTPVALAEKLPSVHLIVLNRNGSSHLKHFLATFWRYNTYPNYTITIVDHGSTDDSQQVVEQWQGKVNVTFLDRKRNYSFSQSNNFAAENRQDDLLFFVNNDIVFVQCVISSLVHYFSDETVGMVGIKLRSPPNRSSNVIVEDGFVQHLGVKFGATSSGNTIGAYELPLHPDALVVANSAWRVPAVTAAALMMRREDFLEIGGFDEGYFYSYEDVDLCLKVTEKLRKQILCANNVVAVHHRGATRSNDDAETRSRYGKNLEHLRSRFGARLRQNVRREAVQGERFLRLEPLRVAFLVSTIDFAAPEADFFTAYELGEELIDLNGWRVNYLPPAKWYDLADFDVVIAMRQDWDPRKIKSSNPHLLKIGWARNWFETWIKLPWLGHFDLIWTASNKSVDAFKQVTKRPVELFRIATNANRFSEVAPDSTLKSDYCFTGSFFKSPRDILSCLDPLALPYRFSLFGHNWDQVPWLEPYWRGALPYPQMPAIYASTSIVVDDCNHTVKNWASVNSRVFDALATGTLVLTNGRLGSQEVFDGLLPVYETRQDLTDLLSKYLSDEAARVDLVAILQEKVLSEHTYRHRAAQAFASIERLFGRLRISLRYLGDDSFSSTIGGLVSGELHRTPYWMRDTRSLPIEDMGDDVVVWVSSEAFPQPKIESDQINVLIHAGTGVNFSSAKFDLVILPDDSCNLTRDDTPTISLFADASSRARCFDRDSGILAFSDARLMRRALLDRMPEIVKAIEEANRIKTDVPSPSAPETHPSSPDVLGIDLVAYPDYRATNPYQKLLYQDLPANISLHFGDIGQALKMQRAAASSRSVVFHLHWTSPILGIEQSPMVARRKLARFIDTLQEFIDAGGRLAWTIHNVVPHEVLHPELEAQLCADLAKRASTIHVHSAAVPEIARPHYDLPAEKIVVGEHGNYIGVYADDVDKITARARLGLSEDNIVFLFMGQIRSYKGLDRLLSAFEAVGNDSARLLIVGNPVNMPLDVMSRRIAANRRIKLVTGHIADDDLQTYFRSADFCVLPYERVLTSGSVYLSLSFGVPVIAPNTGLLPEIIKHDHNGYLYEAGNTEALGAALSHALASSIEERERISRNSVSSAEKLDWSVAQGHLLRNIVASTVSRPEFLKVGDVLRKVFIRHASSQRRADARVAAVVLHYANLDDTMRCVQSLLRQKGKTAQIYIVSNDESAYAYQYLCEAFPDCTVIQSDDNLGYAGGNNLALQLISDTGFDFAWIVNPDIVVPDDFLQRMVTIADTNEDIAIFGSKILFGDRQDIIWFGGGEIDWSNGFEAKHLYIGKKTSEMPGTPFNCDYVTGASLFFRRTLIKSVGLIPEQYFLYCEETHWCMLASRKGLSIRIFPETELLHFKRSEEGGAPTATYLYYFSRASLLMCAEYHPDLLQSTETRLRQTGRIWLSRVRAVNPTSYDLCSFAFELGIAHGLAGVTGRFDFEAEFGRNQAPETVEDEPLLQGRS
jgi:GT2 family glycosyltransferase/glycosyltransferase involved in cell wall biosynthesis